MPPRGRSPTDVDGPDEEPVEERIQSEHRRLVGGAPGASEPQGILLGYRVTCSGETSEVIGRATTVLMALDEHCLREPFPRDDEWSGILPAWFVTGFAPEMSQAAARQRRAWLRSLTYEEKLEYARQQHPWEFSSWIAKFDPDERFCYWWDAKELGPREFILRVETFEYPFPFGPLDWLLRPCGAEKIDYEVHPLG
jgi:hypothetical protein